MNPLVAKRVHVEIQAAVVEEDKIAERVGALDRKGVILPGLREPGVFLGQELAKGRISPVLDKSVIVRALLLLADRGLVGAAGLPTLYSKSEYTSRQLC